MKRHLMLIPLVLLCCLTIGCRQGEEAAAVEVEADVQAIKNLILEFNAVFNSADIDKILSYYADEIVRIPSNSPASVGKDEIRSSYEQMFSEITVQEKYIVKDVRTSGDLAVAHATFTYTATPRDKPEPVKSNGNEIMVLRKQPDGVWKFIYLIWSDERLIYPEQAE